MRSRNVRKIDVSNRMNCSTVEKDLRDFRYRFSRRYCWWVDSVNVDRRFRTVSYTGVCL